jgi:hypothetical protein
MDTIFLDYEEYLEILSEKGSVDHFGRRPDVPTIQLADKKVVITSKLPTTVNGKPAEFSKLLDIVRGKLNYIVESC